MGKYGSSKIADPAERFWSHVEKRGPDECWLWHGAKTPAGHGLLHINKEMVYAHRYAFELANGPITGDGYICHKCNNTSCCNPAHIYLGDAMTNAWDRRAVHPCAVDDLTEQQIGEIKYKLLSGISLRKIAKEYDISYSYVYMIKSGKRFAEVDVWYPDGTTIPARLIHSETTPRYGAVVPVEE